MLGERKNGKFFWKNRLGDKKYTDWILISEIEVGGFVFSSDLETKVRSYKKV